MNTRVLAVGVAAVLAGMVQAALGHEADGKGTVFSWMGDWDPSFYAGMGLRQSTFEDWSVSQFTSFTTRNEDDSDTGFRVSGGMQIVKYLALEASYEDFGEARFTGNSDGSGSLFAPGTVQDRLQADGYGLHLVGRLPVRGDFTLAGKAGFWRLRTEQAGSGNFDVGGQTSFSNSESPTEFSYGAALEYTGFAPIRVALEYDVTGLETPVIPTRDGEIRSIGVSLQYLFVNATPGASE